MKIIIDIDDDDARDIARIIHNANQSNANSHGTLTFEVLASMLLEDVALAARRPGSWEGTNIAQVLASHGYEI